MDAPHAWRQYDTKNYIEAYYYDDVPFMEPAVCWMGGHKTLVLEFPLPEYLVAQLYKITGPSLIVARLFFLSFFLLSAVYLYRSLRLVFNDTVPEIATLIYGLAPLALFYSRAIHIDYFVFAFSFAMLYFAMSAIRSKSFKRLLIALFCASVAFLVKAPYAFYLALPILLFAWHEKKFMWFLKRSLIFVIPVLLFLLWSGHTKTVNSQVPDWSFIPSFGNFTDMWYWYFGPWVQRVYLENWTTIGGRIFWEVLGISGTILLVLGLLFSPKNKQYAWAIVLVVGTLIYVSVFFNLNRIHNYYQLPFVTCCAVVMAMGVQSTIGRLKGKIRVVAMSILVLAFAAESIRFAEKNYYIDNAWFLTIADGIREHTSEDDLVVVSFGGLTPQCPLLLQPAGRYGWSIPIHDITPNIVYQLWKTGKANKLAVVYYGYFEGEFKAFYEAMENKVSVPLNDQGEVLYLCDLNFQDNSSN